MQRRDFVKSLGLLGGGLFVGWGKGADAVEVDKTVELGEYQNTCTLPDLLEPVSFEVPALTSAKPVESLFAVDDFFKIDWSRELDKHLDPSINIVKVDNICRHGDVINRIVQPEIHVKQFEDSAEVRYDMVTRQHKLEHFYVAVMVPDEYLAIQRDDMIAMFFNPAIRAMADEMNKCNGIYAVCLPMCNYPGMTQKVCNVGRIPVRVTTTYAIAQAAMRFNFDLLAADIGTV